MKKYNHLILFFTLSLVIPWVLWFVVAYWSHQPKAPKYKPREANISNKIFATHPDSKLIQIGLFALLVGYISEGKKAVL